MGSYFNNTCNRKVTFCHSLGLFWGHDFLTCFRVSRVGCVLTIKPLWFPLPSWVSHKAAHQSSWPLLTSVL